MPLSVANGADTILTISQFGQLKYQARGLTQTIKVIPAASQQERDVNGILIDLSNPIFRKYSTTITCTDNMTPPFDAVWPGAELVIGCAVYFSFLTGNLGSPDRPIVPHSEFVFGEYTFYNPELTCLVREVSWQSEEWRGNVPWSFTAEEV